MGFSNLKIPKICEQCEKPFEAKTMTTRFCSHLCADKNYKNRKKKEKELKEREKVLEKYVDKIAVLQLREFISVGEAVVLFGISKSTIHRLIKRKVIRSVNLGERLTRINKLELEKLFSPIIIDEKEKQESEFRKKYKKEDCYTISQVSEKFGANPSTVHRVIDKFKIPKEKIGNFVYVPKSKIDKIFIRQ
ncbi:helix-turn-helix domain-containing protein [Riemerella anatipestifer]|nr:helix-turn-helix domain-containing protein [Riemerella anatipestifer]